ncbi:MAG: hypothetical protein ABI837_13900, partial [Acidobacteriota bacterium]
MSLIIRQDAVGSVSVLTGQDHSEVAATKKPGPGHFDRTIYRAESGALVFAAGTIQCSGRGGLDDFNAPGARSSRLNAASQQITRDILNRFENGPAPVRRRAAGRQAGISGGRGRPRPVAARLTFGGFRRKISPTLEISWG